MVSLRRHFVPNPVPPLFGQNRVEAKRRGLLSSIHTRYDDTNQLTGSDYAADWQTDESYVYDENGSRTNNGYTVGSNNQMTSDGTYTYLYDEEGNREYRFEDNDQSGTINTGDTNITKYVWDHRNRLAEVRDYDDYTDYNSNSPSQVVEYAYDFGNRWVRKILDSDGDGTANSSTIFVQDNNYIALQFRDTGSGDLTASDLSQRYLHGNAVDQILADEVVSSLGTAGTVRWPLTDNLGSVRDLAEYDSGTDTTTIANHLVYDAFGNVTSETTPSADSLFLFTGRPFDPDTALQNNLNRWYDAAVARWMSEDPIEFRGRDTNLLRYVGNSPLLSTDPFGLLDEIFLQRPMMDGLAFLLADVNVDERSVCLSVDGDDKWMMRQGRAWAFHEDRRFETGVSGLVAPFDYNWLRKDRAGTIVLTTNMGKYTATYTPRQEEYDERSSRADWALIENLGLNFSFSQAKGKYTVFAIRGPRFSSTDRAAVWNTGISIGAEWTYNNEAGQGAITLKNASSAFGDESSSAQQTHRRVPSIGGSASPGGDLYLTDATLLYQSTQGKWFIAASERQIELWELFGSGPSLSVDVFRAISTGTGGTGFYHEVRFPLPGRPRDVVGTGSPPDSQ